MTDRVVIMVENGVATYVCDEGIEVVIIDLDSLNEGILITVDSLFEDLIPEEILDKIELDNPDEEESSDEEE